MGNVVLAYEGWINFKTKKNWENFSEKYSQTGCCFLCFSNVFLRARLVIVFYVFECFLTSQTGYCFLCFSNVFFRATSELKRDWKKSNVYFLVVWWTLEEVAVNEKKIVISTLASNQQGYLFLVSWEFVRGSIGNQLNNVIFEIVTAKYSFLR